MVGEFRFEEVILRGDDPFERGRQYGSAVQEKVNQHLANWYDIFREELHLSKDRILADVRKFWPFVREYSPEIAKELEGIAGGSKLQLEEILLLNTLNEFFVNQGLEQLGCTSFGVTGDATVGGKTYVGQNDDWKSWAAEVAIILRIETRQWKVLSFTFAGSLPIIGLNSFGIALCINALRDGKVKPGVPIAVICRDILQRKTIGQALFSIARANRATSVNLLLGDENGELYTVEMTKDSYVPIYGQHILVHTNHFLDPRLAESDLALERGTSTIIRYNRMVKLLTKNLGNIDAKLLQGFLADHVNYPESICSHPREYESMRTQSSTIASFIMNTQERTMLIADGNPCEKVFREFRI